jgi:peptidoglycan/xylan/chitin deacetylase (PgdA/CDA1 family)
MSDRPVLRIRAPGNRAAERRYVFDVVFAEWLGIDHELVFDGGSNVRVALAGDPGESLITFPDVFFAARDEDWLTSRSLPARPLAHVALDPIPSSMWGASQARPADHAPAASIPVLYGVAAPGGPASHATDAGAEFSVDVFGSIFFLLTRYEEAVLRERDIHDRFPSSASSAAAEGFLGRPVVDEYVDVLWMSMSQLWPTLARRPSTFRLQLTHDVDYILASRRRRAVLGDLIVRHDSGLALRRLRAVYDGWGGRFDRDPYDTFGLLMDISERHGLRSVFYFMAGNKIGDVDFRYESSDRAVAGVLGRIHERGHEIGLHASYLSFRSTARIRSEFDALKDACRAVGFDQPTWGIRQHYLRFENPVTWRSQDEAGLDHDSTIGWADQIGFRAGTCREYPVFDLPQRQQLRLRERPLIIMDGALLAYVARDLEDAASRSRAVVDHCRRHGGDAVLLFHNHTVALMRNHRFYGDLVDELIRPT